MTTPATHIMVDAHVHLHACHSLQRLFMISLQNFRQALQRFHIYEPFEAFLLLTESAGTNRFDELRAMVGADRSDDFNIVSTPEDITLHVETQGGQSLYVVAGKQIVTAERLEVLALGYPHAYPDGRPLTYVLDDLRESGCLRVIPWGAGKWLGKRGRIVKALIASWGNEPLFLGDNGNRPFFWPLPEVFAGVGKNHLYNLPGSDPLPFSGEEKKAGRCGFMLRGALNNHLPFEGLKSRLIADPRTAIPYGTPERFIPFFKNQLSMQMAVRK
jgi:hypothetical protein